MKLTMREKDFMNVKYYKINIFFMKTHCLWPYGGKFQVTLGRILNCVLILSMMIPMIIRIDIEFYGHSDKRFEVITENIVGVLVFLGLLVKYALTILAQDKLNYVWQLITNDWSDTTDSGELNILRKRAKTAYILNFFYSSYLVIVTMTFVSVQTSIPILLNYFYPKNESRPMKLCYYAEFFIDQQKYFFYFFVHSVLSMCAAINLAVHNDIDLVSCTQHLLGLFDIIGYRLNQTFEESENLEKLDTLEGRLKIKERIINSIQMHQKSIEFAELVRTAYDLPNFIITVFYVIGTATVLINITANLVARNYVNLARILCVFLACFVYQLYVNWPGQKVFDKSDNLTIEIYNCNWFKFPTESQLMLKFMLMRCLIPSNLTAGPFVQMNFATVLLILRVSFSYFTVVGRVNNPLSF